MSNPSKKENKLSSDVILEIKNQIEYYLSDENLKKDCFFHERISSDPEGYLELKYILKCNKIKNKGWTKEDLKKGIEISKSIELDKTGEKVRRKNNLKLPELLLLQKKRKKEDKKEDKMEDKKEDKKEKDEKEKKEDIKKDKIILKITCKDKSSSSWKQIFEEFKNSNPELEVDYGRFKETEGHIGILLKENQNLENIKYKDKFKVEEIEFTVEKCEGEDLIKFWKEHGSHYEYCIRQKEKYNKSKKAKDEKHKKYLINPITLGKEEYSNIDLIKSQTRNILNKYKDNEKLKGDDKKFILDLWKYHHNYDEKVKEMDYITVAPNEEYKYSRCFFIVDKNKNKKDFSFKKCIENILEKQNDK